MNKSLVYFIAVVIGISIPMLIIILASKNHKAIKAPYSPWMPSVIDTGFDFQLPKDVIIYT